MRAEGDLFIPAPAPIKIEPRDYQQAAVDAPFEWWPKNPGKYPLIVLPTGAGKSIVAAMLMQRLMHNYAKMTILFLAHRKELIEQNEKKLLAVWPDAPVGVYSAGLNRREIRPITIASRDTIATVLDTMDYKPMFCVIDEAQNVSHKEGTRYRNIIRQLEERNPNFMLMGITATPFRVGNGYIYGPDQVFSGVCYELKMRTLIDQGYLAPLVAVDVAKESKIDITGVKITHGELNQKELEAVSINRKLIAAAITEWIKHAFLKGRKHTLFFCVSIAHAEAVQLELASRGHEVPLITGKTPPQERDRVIQEFLAGKYVGIMNVGVFTEGTDFPLVDCICNLRAVMSLGLFMQMMGRGMRPSPETGKKNCIAEGQEVLTDMGLVRIENVTKEMKVWDGCNFVNHDGIIYKGEREVIEYAGLTATEDHKVWTEEGWKPFGYTADKQIAIRVTGNDGIPLQESSGYRRSGTSRKGICESIGRMLRMWRYTHQGSIEPKKKDSWLHKLWLMDKKEKRKNTSGKNDSRLDSWAGRIRNAAMQEPKGSKISRLRRTRNRISISLKSTLRYLLAFHSGTGRFVSTFGNGQDRQRWSLRRGEYSLINEKSECVQYESYMQWYSFNSSIQNGISTREILRQNSAKDGKGNEFSGNRNEIQPKVEKTKRKVWDILNAGPLHRFTVEGLLVSNCKVLDFGGCIERFGRIDLAQPAERKPGPPRTKVCQKCSTINSVFAKTCENESCDQEWEILPAHKTCPSCGEANPPGADKCIACGEIFINHDATPSDANIMSGVNPLRHYTITMPLSCVCMISKTTGNPYLRVWYRAGFVKSFSKILMIGMEGYAGTKAEKEWKRITVAGTPVPNSPEEAHRLIQSGHQFKSVDSITVDVDSEYKDIVSIKYSKEQPVCKNSVVEAVYTDDVPF